MSENHQDEVRADLQDRPGCFGDLDAVCPQDKEGFLQPQAYCLPCPSLKPCLQEALRKKGLIASPSAVAQASCGLMDFVKRWSSRKLHQSKGSNLTTSDKS
jgi:hypothetical protein